MRLAERIRTKPALTAVQRAQRAWASMALETRCELREMGVHGDLRRLSDAASGARGKAVPAGIAGIAREMRDRGVPHAEARERLTQFAADVVALVYHDTDAA